MTFYLQRRRLAGLSLVALLVAAAVSCYSVRPLSLEALRAGEAPTDQALKLTYAGGWLVLEPPWRIDYPWAIGKVDQSLGRGSVSREPVAGEEGTFRYNLEDATRVELRSLRRGRSLGLGLGIGGGLALIVLAIAMASFSVMSCPTVYLTDAQTPPRLVGELFPGATGASRERLDWLALPSLADPERMRLVIENDHAEVQHLQAAGLVRIAHAEGTSAVATAGGTPVILADLRPPLGATAGGADVLDLVGSTDGKFWQASQAEILRSSSDTVEAVFDINDTAEQALVLRFENTVYSAALLALRVDEACSRVTAGDGSLTRDCGQWRRETGFDAVLRVRDSSGERTLFLGAAGIGGARMTAVPIGRTSGMVHVRVDGGAGFLRVDQIALAAIVDRSPAMHRLAPIATTFRGAQGVSTTSATSGAAVTLATTGDRLELDFALPIPQPPGTWFLAARGYYELQPAARERLAELRRGWSGRDKSAPSWLR